MGSSRWCNRTRKRNKGFQTGMKRSKTLIPDNTIIYVENLMESYEKSAKRSEFMKVTGYKINIQNSAVFLYANKEQLKIF